MQMSPPDLRLDNRGFLRAALLSLGGKDLRHAAYYFVIVSNALDRGCLLFLDDEPIKKGRAQEVSEAAFEQIKNRVFST